MTDNFGQHPRKHPGSNNNSSSSSRRNDHPFNRDKNPRKGERGPHPRDHDGAPSDGSRFDKQGIAQHRYKHNEPPLPDDLDLRELDSQLRGDLRTLDKQNADRVASHLLAVQICIEEDPERALLHARAAKDRAGRIGSVRQVAGTVAYMCGLWQEAMSELKAARRITGNDDVIPMILDCQRGLGRPEKAIEMVHNTDLSTLHEETFIELKIVESGARSDLGDKAKALTTLEIAQLNPKNHGSQYARLFYAYAKALLDLNRISEAKEWFSNSYAADPDATDAFDQLTHTLNLESSDATE